MGLELVPVTLAEAKAFIAEHHRHHDPPLSGRFSVGVAKDGEVVGVAIAGRPVSRVIQANDPYALEVTRVATDGTKNACSMLYGACRRAGKALGYKRFLTYTLPEEGGAALRGAGWELVEEAAGGGSWSRENRPRVDTHPTQRKLRWEATA